MDLLPAIDILGGKAVRLAKGDYSKVTIYNDDPIAQARQFKEAGADWIHVVDLDGARTGEPANIAVIEGIIAETGLKIEVGGGVRNRATIDRLVEAGASRIVLGTSLVSDSAFAREALAAYPDILTAGVDAKNGEVAVAGWEEGSGVGAEDFVAHMAELGFKHLVFTDISRDGMRTGIDAERYAHLAFTFGNPVIASGGVKDMTDLENLAKVASSIEGVIAGRAIYEGSLDVAAAAAFCKQVSEER